MFTEDRQLYIAHCDNGNINLVGKMANRHGLICGATGTGKTVTLQDQKPGKLVIFIQYHKQISLTLSDILRIFSQSAVQRQSCNVVIDDFTPVNLLQGEFILVVCLQMSFLRQFFGINRIFFDRRHTQIRNQRSNHQGYQQ